MSQILASISLLSLNRQFNSTELNKVLSEYSSLISARLGVNVQKNCTQQCPGLILLAIEGDKELTVKLTEDLKKIPELVVSLNILQEV